MDATRKTVIVTDSSCDLSDEQLSRYGIRMISLRIVCQNAEYRDRIDIQEDELYELLTRELPKTSLPLPEDVSALYESLAQEGVTDVIHMSISSGLSGTFNMVRMITQDFESRMRARGTPAPPRSRPRTTGARRAAGTGCNIRGRRRAGAGRPPRPPALWRRSAARTRPIPGRRRARLHAPSRARRSRAHQAASRKAGRRFHVRSSA